MRIDVLNGVNLNLLGRRDPVTYGDQSRQDLETQIYAWARELGLQVRCRQTNHEGRVHRASSIRRWARWTELVVNPGAWTHYSLGDPRRPRAVRRGRSSRCTSPTSTSARSGGGFSVLHRPRRSCGSSERVSRVTGTRSRSSTKREAASEAVLERLERGESSRRSLVTYGVNVRYLTGFDSSNCALLVEPGGGTTLYTDFRYLEAAQGRRRRRGRAHAARRRRCAR